MIKVSQKTYEAVYNKYNGICQHPCCNRTGVIYHHIIYRSECKATIDDERNGVILCPQHHTIGKEAPHNSRFWKYYYYKFLPRDFIDKYSPVKWAYIQKIIKGR